MKVSQSNPLRLCLAMLAVISFVLVTSTSAQPGGDLVKPSTKPAPPSAVPYTSVVGSPLQVNIGDDNSFQVFNDDVGGQGQIYPEWQLSTADMGIFVRIIGPGTLYAPNFTAHGITATGGLGTYTPWTPVSLSAVSGTGTAGDPYRVTVVSDAGPYLRMTMDVTYVNGDYYFFHDCKLTNISGSEVCFHFYVGSDIYLANSDFGYPYKVGNSVGGQDITLTYHILHIPVLPPAADHYCGKFYHDVWLDIANPPLNDDLSGYLDNGAALEWRELCIQPGGSVTIRSATSFGEIPEIALNIPDQCIYSGDIFSPFDLDIYATGVPPNTWTYTGNVSLSVNIDVNNICTITYPPGWLGCEDIIFTVTDSYGAVDTDTASFCVRPIPDVLDIPDQNEPFSSFDLDDYIDPNSVIHPDSVTWSVTGMSCLQVTINPTTHVVTVTDPGNACCLPETLTFTATVAGCYNDILTDSDNAIFTPNRAPIALCQNVTVIANANCVADTSIDAGSYDPDGDAVTIVETPAGPYPIGVTLVTLVITDNPCGWADTCQGTVTVINNPPVVDCPPNATIHWGDTYSDTASATDPDPGHYVTFSLGAESPTTAFIHPTTGVITWPTTGADVCGDTIVVIATDQCGAADTCETVICVYNDPPVFDDCPTDTVFIYWNYTASGSVHATDPDNGPASPVVYSMASFDGPNSVSIDPITGEWEWPTAKEDQYIGYFELCIEATDSANTCDPCSPHNADTCCVIIRVVPTPLIVIEKTHDTYQGHYEYVSITTERSWFEMGGFDFLIAYDASALTFMEATPGQLLEDCGWEYFTYRYGWQGNCEGPCPSGLLRIVAIAETNNGPNHPSCFGPPDTDPHELAEIKFYVTSDYTFECMYVPIRFFWHDCGDNAISSVTGDTLWISDQVFDFEGNEVTGALHYGGHWWLDGPPFPVQVPNDACMNPDTTKPDPIPLLDFIHGGIDIICIDSIDARGDINLNDVPNEIADAVLFTNYFIWGYGVFDINPPGQVAATDVNNDGRVLTVGDLVYLIRIVVGDALPFPKLSPYAHSVEVLPGDVVMTRSDVDIGAALFVFDGAGDATLLADGMKMLSDVVDGQLRVLVWSDNTGRIPAGTNDLIAVSGDINLIETSFSDYNGNMMNVDLAKITPNLFALHQNYPNPFNPLTDITIYLPEELDWKLEIYNIMGQIVESFSGRDVGEVTVTWNATAKASGIYFYKATAGDYAETRKMVLMK